MRDALVHRGPDSGGERVDPHVALGIRRLRIIDLATGDQPMSNEDGRVWTVFNGEIYNYRELRDELAARGHVLHTSSDTEVIPHLYEEHGPMFVRRLAGMFAIALWDGRDRTLVLARDRLGKKPLLYHAADGEISFASEHVALLRALGRVPGVDPRAVRLYLRLGYVPAPHDAFKGVRKLLPAHVLVWRDGRIAVERYWQLPDGETPMDEADAVAEFRRVFERAVARRLISDVPLGALLSGGVDSSAIVATMSQFTQRVRTFSIGFDEADYSELSHARRVSSMFQTEHEEFIVRPDAIEVLPELVRHYGEPYADSSALPSFYLAKMTRRHVTVALAGDGGDEVFAGYERYDAVHIAARLDCLPQTTRAALSGVVSTLPDAVLPPRVRRAVRFLSASALRPTNRYLRWLGVFDDALLDRLLDPEFAAHSSSPAVVPGLSLEIGRSDPVRDAQRIDMLLYLPDDLLVKMDIASMANSLEVRCPFLDHELVEFVWRLPTRMKNGSGQRKYLLKRAFDGILPRENMYRRKQGFGVPIGPWMRDRLADYVRDVVLSAEALGRGYFKARQVRALATAHISGQADHTHRLWALLMLELWHRSFKQH